MSSTNRGTVREADDFYETPAWCTRAILPQLGPLLAGKRILEPSAGRGAIVHVLLEAGATPQRILCVERNPALEEHLANEGLSIAPMCADFLAVELDAGRHDLVIMNPPFSAALEHVERAIGLLAPGGMCAALLRLAFCTGAKRAPFRAAHPFDVYPLASRPSFTAEALAWMTEEDLRSLARTITPRATKQNPKPKPRTETTQEVRSRLKGSDSADYAWFVFHGPPAPGRPGC